MKKLLIAIFTALLITGVLFLFEYSKFYDGKLHIVVCDVGQGDAIFITTPAKTDVLIDGGPDQKVLSCLSDHMPFWDKTIEAIIMTHPDADHSTGLIHVLKRYKVLAFYTEEVKGTTQTFKLLDSILADKNLSAKFLYAGDTLKDNSGMKLITLWPTKEAIREIVQNRSKPRLNDISVIGLLTFGNFKGLFTADAGEKVENQIESEAGKITLLKIPHHGSATGMNDQFLRIVQPELAVISVGNKNRYDHPTAKILDLLKNRNIKYLRTDQDGKIEIITDGKKWWLGP